MPGDARVLLFNDGKITGRQAKLRRLVDNDNREYFSDLIRETVFRARQKKMYSAQVYIGLHPDFMLKAHLVVPEGYENTLYSWLLNFQIVDDEYTQMYEQSRKLPEGDIFIYSDPDFYPDDFPNGLALFDAENNCACLFGMRYFGEHKKGTLTLAWTIAERNGYTACHGGQKQFNLPGGKKKVIGVFGLSGSGKSTITLSNHDGKFDTVVLHDDAFIISNDDASSICLEQSYFDKTQDYPLTNEQTKYFVTVQNCGATLDDHGKVVLVTEDIRNGNGRTIKSKFATPNRIYKFDHPCDAIFWIMKDGTLPPVLKVNAPELASVMGATLATKRTSAEYVPGEDPNKLVIVPYANPFRLYPLVRDYNKFKQLFAERGVACYIINTGYFLDKKITPAVTLGLIEDIVNDKAKFVPLVRSAIWNTCRSGFVPDFDDPEYLQSVKARMNDRLEYISKLDEFSRSPAKAWRPFARSSKKYNQGDMRMGVKIVDTALRDGHQSLFATRMRTEEILSILPDLDAAGYHALEVWGGATFDACLRFLNETSWERLRQIRKVCKNTKLQMLFRQNILGCKHYPDDIVEMFVKKSLENGIDIIRVFDALNDLRNMETAVTATKRYGGHCQVAFCYTTSPIHTVEYFVALAKKIEAMGADSLCIKDMSGVLLPEDAYRLVKELKANVGIPIELHSHCTAGVAHATYMKAIEAGVDIIDTALSPLSSGTSQPPTESFQYILRGTPYDPGLDLDRLNAAAEKIKSVRDKYLASGQLDPKALMVNPLILQYQLPGGMLSNLMSQLKNQGASDRYEEVLREVPAVRADLGYPPLVTPLSRWSGPKR